MGSALCCSLGLKKGALDFFCFANVGSCLGPLVGLVSGPLVLRVRNLLRSLFGLAAGRSGRGPQAAAGEKLGGRV